MEKIERLKRELVYKGAIIDVYKDYVKIPNGNIAEWDYIGHKGAAAVLPVNEEGKIIMVRQYRNALNRETIEIPAGGLNSIDEPTKDAAARELEEETGYRSENITYLISVVTTVAFCDEKIDIYLAKDLVKTQQNLDEDEFVEVEEYELDELCDMIFKGQIVDSKTVSAILAYKAICGQKG
ncbi:MAG: NUDIX hydrolase [Lachnospiraceae bacterium]|nr:NUDIX hydrolase [Lachnospira sp.]MBR6697820.1 NUDIX hydrolase [Lachnospiraceae bacterium]